MPSNPIVLTFDDLGFCPAFQLEVGPEFPGDGHWSCPIVGFDLRGERTPFLALDTAIVVRFRPDDDAEWVASFTGAGGSSMTGLYGLPSADHVLVVHRGEGLVVDASDPAAPAVGVGWAIHQVVPVHEPALVLLVGFTEITALDAQGVRWTTPRLCLDDLLVERVADDHIVCSGEFPPRQTLVVSLTSGERLSGPAFRW